MSMHPDVPSSVRAFVHSDSQPKKQAPHRAQAELEAAGIEIVGQLGLDSTWEWIHFRAPDGNLYELASLVRP